MYFMKIHNLRSDKGWTFIEATLAVLLVTIVVLGLTIVMLAFKEHLERGVIVRMMDQYGNDVIEWMTHDMRNAQNIMVRPGAQGTHRVFVYRTDLRTGRPREIRYTADLRNARILINDRPEIDRYFPPSLKRGDAISIERFTVTPYGTDTPNMRERQERFRRNDKFLNATYDIRFTLRYTKRPQKAGQRAWFYEKEYFNRVYMRNMNLIVREGLFQ